MTEKIAVFAPMPSPRMSTTTAENAQGSDQRPQRLTQLNQHLQPRGCPEGLLDTYDHAGRDVLRGAPGYSIVKAARWDALAFVFSSVRTIRTS